MVLCPVDRFWEAYTDIREQAKDGSTSVAIFVAPDCDSICAAHIFTVRFLCLAPLIASVAYVVSFISTSF